MATFKVIVAGSRDFGNYKLLEQKLNRLLSAKVVAEDEIVVISGCARGADSLGELYAKTKGYAVERHPADWDKNGRSAGYIRNEQMAEVADALVAFWDGKSRGTAHMIETMNRLHKPVRVVRF